MEANTSFTLVAPPIFNGDNYKDQAIKMTVYLKALDLWKDVKEDYEIAPLPTNPMMDQLNIYQERKRKKSKAKACLFFAISSAIFMKIMNLELTKAI